MPFGVVSGVGREMSVLDGVHVSYKEKGSWGGFFPIGLNGGVFLNRNVFDSCVKG